MEKNIVISTSLIIICIFLLFSCKNKESVDNDIISIKEKVMFLKFFSFIYDPNCIDFEKKERADTTFRTSLSITENSTPHLYYVTKGDCSFCISKSLNFIKAWIATDTKKLPLKIILKSGKEIFIYYLHKFCENYDEQVQNEIRNIELIMVSDDVTSPDGLYLILNKRIINYADWQN